MAVCLLAIQVEKEGANRPQRSLQKMQSSFACEHHLVQSQAWLKCFPTRSSTAVADNSSLKLLWSSPLESHILLAGVRDAIQP